MTTHIINIIKTGLHYVAAQMTTGLACRCRMGGIRRASGAGLLALCLVLTPLSAILHAGEVDVVQVEIKHLGDNQFRIDVTLKHDDTGWDHYANKWEVLDESGQVIGTRELAHPHVNEQPFTRSLTVALPEDIKTIVLRGYDSEHADGGTEMSVEIPDR